MSEAYFQLTIIYVRRRQFTVLARLLSASRKRLPGVVADGTSRRVLRILVGVWGLRPVIPKLAREALHKDAMSQAPEFNSTLNLILAAIILLVDALWRDFSAGRRYSESHDKEDRRSVASSCKRI